MSTPTPLGHSPVAGTVNEHYTKIVYMDFTSAGQKLEHRAQVVVTLSASSFPSMVNSTPAHHRAGLASHCLLVTWSMLMMPFSCLNAVVMLSLVWSSSVVLPENLD